MSTYLLPDKTDVHYDFRPRSHYRQLIPKLSKLCYKRKRTDISIFILLFFVICLICTLCLVFDAFCHHCNKRMWIDGLLSVFEGILS